MPVCGLSSKSKSVNEVTQCSTSEPFALRVIGDDMALEFCDGNIIVALLVSSASVQGVGGRRGSSMIFKTQTASLNHYQTDHNSHGKNLTSRLSSLRIL